MELEGYKGWEFRLFNGFSLGLKRCKNEPAWIPVDEGYDIYLFSGLQVLIGFLDFRVGSYIQLDAWIEAIIEDEKGAE
jgi:hypothetical protein